MFGVFGFHGVDSAFCIPHAAFPDGDEAMPWRVGIDEAGYGPNLGPLVLASTACHVPDDAPISLWDWLSTEVRRKSDKDKKDTRLLIDDSKKVHDGKYGLAKLEEGILSVITLNSLTLSGYLRQCGLGTSLADTQAEPWYQPSQPLPVAADPERIAACKALLASGAKRTGLVWGPLHTVVIPTPQFNALLDVYDVKSGVLTTGVLQLFRQVLHLPGTDPVHIAIDKLGGRHFYAPLIHEAFPDGWTRVVRESPDQCEYIVYGLLREVHLRFEPRADGTHLNVALASMAAKYLRELCMIQFNAYWQAKLPGLESTAGYPVDAARFMAAIRPTMEREQIAADLVWRRK